MLALMACCTLCITLFYSVLRHHHFSGTKPFFIEGGPDFNVVNDNGDDCTDAYDCSCPSEHCNGTQRDGTRPS